MKNMVHEGKSVQAISTSNSYVRITDLGNGKSQIDKFNKGGYIKERTKEKNAQLFANQLVTGPQSNPKKTTWLQMFTELDTNYSGNYTVYGFYSWLTDANNKKTDVIGLSHDSNVTFDDNAITHNYYYWDNTENYLSDTYMTASSNGAHSASTGSYFEFPFNYWDTDVNHLPYGFIQVSAHKANSNALRSDICFTYAHQQTVFSVTPTVSFSGFNIVVTPTDKFESPNDTLDAYLY
ncbi:hypothetical protein [Clostridium sp. DMHC 10]|uniref:hypothetical protein n=2 Tax=Clostridium TaxID=1485 RepID=UPI000A8CE52A|nr:hypothetical protein [Clostridium sp. DMHC 10]